MATHSANKSNNNSDKVRIDKWLWAARFFKTRSLASDAIKNGKVQIDNSKVKPSRDVQIGETVTIKQGPYSKEIKVIALSQRRGPATEAQKLYRELADSIEAREKIAFLRKAQPGLREHGMGRPTKKQRRQIIQFIEKQDE